MTHGAPPMEAVEFGLGKPVKLTLEEIRSQLKAHREERALITERLTKIVENDRPQADKEFEAALKEWSDR